MRVLIPGLVAVSLLGCGPESLAEGDLQSTESALSRIDNGRVQNGRVQNGRVQNGRFQNGRFQNGRVQNGRVQNGFLYGLSLNGASSGGVRDGQFDAWFAESGDFAGADREMRYVVKCAAPVGTTLRYTALNGVTYTWAGAVGMAPQWVNPNRTYVDAATLAVEQQRVSACLLALTNANGVSVPIALKGLGQTLDPAEYLYFPNEEGNFFGNLFLTTPTAYSCTRLYNFNGPYRYGPGRHTAGRSCAADPASCSIVGRGDCFAACAMDAARDALSCTGLDGVRYPAIETLVRGFAGDGMCDYSNPDDLLTDCQDNGDF